MKIGFLLCLMVCTACTGHAVSSPLYDVTYGRDNSGEITVHSQSSNTLIEVSSAFGIGSGTAVTDKYLQSEMGYYEIQLPRSLFDEGTTSITLHWVDFYR